MLTACNRNCGDFSSRKLLFHEESLSSAERTQFALIRNFGYRRNVVRYLETKIVEMKYTIKVWLFTVLLSPLLLLILGIFINNSKFGEILGFWPMLFFMIIYGAFLSAPAMLLFWLIQKKLTEKFSVNNSKIILSFYSFISVWITSYIFDKGLLERGFQQIFWVIIYSITIVLGIWFFKIKNMPTIKIQ